MGQGAQMTVQNKAKKPIILFINGVNCMYDGGQQGSNLQAFNSVTVQGGQNVGPQYIEDVDSGGCAFETATFTLVVNDTQSNNIGNVAFSEGSSQYTGTSSNANLIQVFCSNNSGSESTITVTITGTGGST